MALNDNVGLILGGADKAAKGVDDWGKDPRNRELSKYQKHLAAIMEGKMTPKEAAVLAQNGVNPDGTDLNDNGIPDHMEKGLGGAAKPEAGPAPTLAPGSEGGLSASALQMAAPKAYSSEERGLTGTTPGSRINPTAAPPARMYDPNRGLSAPAPSGGAQTEADFESLKDAYGSHIRYEGMHNRSLQKGFDADGRIKLAQEKARLDGGLVDKKAGVRGKLDAGKHDAKRALQEDSQEHDLIKQEREHKQRSGEVEARAKKAIALLDHAARLKDKEAKGAFGEKVLKTMQADIASMRRLWDGLQQSAGYDPDNVEAIYKDMEGLKAKIEEAEMKFDALQDRLYEAPKPEKGSVGRGQVGPNQPTSGGGSLQTQNMSDTGPAPIRGPDVKPVSRKAYSPSTDTTYILGPNGEKLGQEPGDTRGKRTP